MVYSWESCWIGSKKLLSAAMKANTAPVDAWPLITSYPPISRISTVTSADRNSTPGKYAACSSAVDSTSSAVAIVMSPGISIARGPKARISRALIPSENTARATVDGRKARPVPNAL